MRTRRDENILRTRSRSNSTVAGSYTQLVDLLGDITFSLLYYGGDWLELAATDAMNEPWLAGAARYDARIHEWVGNVWYIFRPIPRTVEILVIVQVLPLLMHPIVR